MTNDEVEMIEAGLGITLPPEYVVAATAGEFSDPIHDNARHILGINSAFRSGEFGDQDWDEQLFAFGHDGAGNYFCFYTAKIDDGVFLRDHETLEITQEYDSFNDFLLQWSTSGDRSFDS